MLQVRHARLHTSGSVSSTNCRDRTLCRVGCCNSATSPRPFQVVALDVEYIHFRCNDQLVILPGEVCVVDVRCDVLVHSYCNPGTTMQTSLHVESCRSLLMGRNFVLQAGQRQHRATGLGE